MLPIQQGPSRWDRRRARGRDLVEPEPPAPPARKRLYTIGYRGLSYDALVQELRRNGVEALLDVRAVPWSQDPRYTASALLAYLAGKGIDYLDGRAWGNPYRHAPTLEPFRQHLQDRQELTHRLGVTLRDDHRVVCLLCLCSQAAQCHRGVICEALQQHLPGVFDVVHLPTASYQARQSPGL